MTAHPIPDHDEEFADRNLDLIFKFEKYVVDHPEVAERIPDDAIVAMQVEDDDAFNHWSRKLAQEQADDEHPIIYVTIKKMASVRSRIEDLELQTS